MTLEMLNQKMLLDHKDLSLSFPFPVSTSYKAVLPTRLSEELPLPPQFLPDSEGWEIKEQLGNLDSY